jgi:long-chain acyl-CoA synthetase
MTVHTINDIFYKVVESAFDRVMLSRQAIDWVSISSQELYRSTTAVARTLLDWGISPGDRIAILSENRPEWAIADFASLLVGAVVVPVYSTLTDEQTAYILRDSGARVLFVSSKKHLDKVTAILGQTPVERVMVMDAVETAHATHMDRVMREGPSSRDLSLDARAQAVRPEDLATIIYTSGTTGTPKGAMLTHGNLVSNILCSLREFALHSAQDEVMISFLPLSHVTARHVDYAMFYRGVTLAYCPLIDHLPRSLLEVRPTIFVAVPRVYEKIHSEVERNAARGAKHALYRWALSVGRKRKPEILNGKTPSALSWKLANRLVFSRIRQGMGGRVRYFISGGAPLGLELAEWYATVGIRIHEGYGLTETSPVIAVNTPNAHKLGTVGKPLSNIEVRLAEDGEILVRGPSVFHGYWNRPEETRNAFENGFFKTGDVGVLDADGFLSITDRKKDLIKTSGGKFIAPQPLENSLKLNPLIAEAAVVGDRRRFPAVLIAPYFSLLEDWAHTNHIAFSSRQDLVAHPKVRALYEGIVEDFNQNLARFEKLKRVLLVPDEFCVADGTLTPSLKLRRRVIEERYRQKIEEMYAQAEPAVASPSP